MDLINIISKWLAEKHPTYETILSSYKTLDLPRGFLVRIDTPHVWWTGDIYHDRISIGMSNGRDFKYIIISAHDLKFFEQLETHLV